MFLSSSKSFHALKGRIINRKKHFAFPSTAEKCYVKSFNPIENLKFEISIILFNLYQTNNENYVDGIYGNKEYLNLSVNIRVPNYSNAKLQ